MGSERMPGTDLSDVLDRVLDKGIVVDAWLKFSIVGVDLLTLEARAVIASLETYLKYNDAMSEAALIGAP